MPRVRSFTVLPALPESLSALSDIAGNLFWSWNPEVSALFRRMDNDLWEASGHNPVKLLGSISQRRLDDLAENKGFICQLNRAADKLRNYLSSPSWFERVNNTGTKPLIAYFSAEYGIHECLPLYSGGLGGLAGDYLKSASDLGIPLVAVGLLYQKGYFRQYLNIDGWQQEVYAENDFYNMPISLVTDDDGRPVTIFVDYPGRRVYAQIWSISIGKVKLYMLDTNIDANSGEDRVITATLYGGDREMRIKQEIMLGIGGLRALTAMGISPTVCHMNEGHAAFMALERVRELLEKTGLNFSQAAEVAKAANVFTIHTPVKAGNDEFPTDMMDKYFSGYFPSLGIDRKGFLGLGKVEPDNEAEPFQMPVLALKLSAYRNGVSELHGDVTRRMWANLWPQVPESEIPITSITNGAHVKSWLSEEMNSLYERYVGLNWTDDIFGKTVWKNIDQIPDEELWRTHTQAKGSLISFARKRLRAQIQRRGTYHTELNWAEEVLNPEALTIGFAKRFASYKRGNLLLKDPARLARLLKDTTRPIQFIFAGKSHPRDGEGKEIIRQIIHFANQFEVRKRIVFLEDYDINVARMLVRGVDVWLNTPRRPMEASGTSGMKAAINGVLNLSTFDGWWCEGYRPDAGWVIGAGENYDDPSYQDMVESQALYNLLENEVIPLFYARSDDGLPRPWIHRVKNSIKWIAPRFNTHRMAGEYVLKFYNPAAAQGRHLIADSMSRAKALAEWKARIRKSWPNFDIRDVQVEVDNGQQLNPKQPQVSVGSQLNVTALIKLGDVSCDDVSVELYHGPVDAWGNIIDGAATAMTYKEGAGQGEYLFAGSVPCTNSGRQGLAVRILPRHHDLTNPYELGLILWEKTGTAAAVYSQTV